MANHVTDDSTPDNRALIWHELSMIFENRDEHGYIFLHFTDLYGDDIFERKILIDLGFIERDFRVPSPDKNADNWRKYFKRDVYKITTIGEKVLEHRGTYIHEGLKAVDELKANQQHRSDPR